MLSQTLQRAIRRLAFRYVDKIESRKCHFTFIVRRNRIISFGFNRIYYTHPLANKFEFRYNDIHSELAAICRFPHSLKELKDYDIINVRLKRDNNLYGLARPCSKCIKMLHYYGVFEIYYSNEMGGFSHEQIL